MASTPKTNSTQSKKKRRPGGNPQPGSAAFYIKKKDDTRFERCGGMRLVQALAQAIHKNGGAVPEAQAKRFCKVTASAATGKRGDIEYLTETIFRHSVGKGYLRAEAGLVRLTGKGLTLAAAAATVAQEGARAAATV